MTTSALADHPVAKTNPGNYFEDFSIGQIIHHATPRTVTVGDVALYTALFGSRFAVQSADTFARAVGYNQAPVDDLLVFHIVFGKTVPDISLNAIANLGYADCRFMAPVYPGDTLSSVSEVIGLKENSNRETGTVYVRSRGRNQRGDVVLEYTRWVMVRKHDTNSPAVQTSVPSLPDRVEPSTLGSAVPSIDTGSWNAPRADGTGWDPRLSGSPHRWGNYARGEKIDHVDGMTLEEAEHQMATRLFQNTAKVHFNQHTEGKGRFGRRLVYGGVVISLARALSFNGLGNAFHIAAINAGRHVAPCFAGDTIYAWSEVLDTSEIAGRSDIGALRTRLVATKNLPCAGHPYKSGADYVEGVVLDLDLWLVLPC